MKKLLLAILLFAGIGISNALAQQQEAYYVNCWKCNGLRYTSTTCPSCNGKRGSEAERYTKDNYWCFNEHITEFREIGTETEKRIALLMPFSWAVVKL